MGGDIAQPERREQAAQGGEPRHPDEAFGQPFGQPGEAHEAGQEGGEFAVGSGGVGHGRVLWRKGLSPVER